MFKIGDRVKFKKSSVDTGMIDATEEDVFTVRYVSQGHMILTEMEECWNVSHFEHVKEEIMNNTEEQEIKWEVGQEVWDVRYGKGIVDTLLAISYQYPIDVVFADGGTASYTSKGLNRCRDVYRSLFFSEPKIEAERFPPKKPFTPALLAGEEIVVVHIDGYKEFITVMEDVEDRVFGDDGHAYMKCSCSFYKLGEEIKFS